MNNYIKKNLGWIIFGILAAIPVVRWFMINNISFKFSNFYIGTTSLGQIAGLLGMTLFALNLITGSKLKFVDKLFFGLPNALYFHAKTGAIAFCLIMFHPLLLAIKYLQFSIRDTAMFFVPQESDAISWGIYALILMAVLIVLTLYVKLKYHIWLFSHKFMVLAFVFAVIHVFSVTSDISKDLFLRYYILSLAFVGLSVNLYNFLEGKVFSNKLNYNVKKIIRLSEDISQIVLEPVSKTLKFFPGQFVFIKFISKNIGRESHPFSISSAPGQNNLEFTIKNLGDFTSKIPNLMAGDKALVSNSFGEFSYLNFAGKDQVWLAGGIGITPFLSMAKSLPENNLQKIDLYYCTRNKEEGVLLDELEKIKSQTKNFNIIYWFSDQRGFLTAKNVVELSSGLADKEIFLCGPLQFMEDLKHQFSELGVKDKNIHWEKFSF